MGKIVATLTLECFTDHKSNLEMHYVSNYSDKIKEEHKKACQTVFNIVKNSFESNIVEAINAQRTLSGGLNGKKIN